MAAPKNSATPTSPPDAKKGIKRASLAENLPFAAQVDGEDIVIVRTGEDVFAVGAKCSHYGAPLVQGRVINNAIYCPWHQASFCLKDGHTRRAPGLDGISSWHIEHDQDSIRVTKKRSWATATSGHKHPPHITFVGAGAATYAAVVGLRANGYKGPITIFGDERDAPYDRIKLSKAYLSGKVSDDKLALHAAILQDDENTHWRLGAAVTHLDLTRRTLKTAATEHPFHSLVLAHGARPNRLDIAGADKPHVHVLRSLNDARTLHAALKTPQTIVVVGAGFIGLEATAQLTALGHTVHVVAPKGPPMAAIVGEACAKSLEAVHTAHGAVFHWGDTVVRIADDHVLLSNNTSIKAHRVLLALGVKPNEELAQAAGLATGNGIHVDNELKTACPDVFAIGDVAAYPHPQTQQRQRIEHWAVAEQMGFVVADNLLGHRRSFTETPFFWTEHHDLKLRYVGHAKKVVRARVFGDFNARSAAVILFGQQAPEAVVTCGRDDLALLAQQAFETGSENQLEKLFEK